jgi:hypothetical protein
VKWSSVVVPMGSHVDWVESNQLQMDCQKVMGMLLW